MAIVAIIPYRDRAPQIAKLIPELLKRNVDRVVVSEQAEGKAFNRGLAKNVGAAFASPGLRDDDTLYFHDVDLMPGAKVRSYPAVSPGTVVHLYGHRHCLGGVVGVTYGTFKRIGGFCNNQWAWGGEDRGLQQAAEAVGVGVDRSLFRQRFTDDAWFAEMDSAGRVMPGLEAKARFLQDPKVSQVPERCDFAPGVDEAGRWVERYHVSASRVDNRITTVLYHPIFRDGDV